MHRRLRELMLIDQDRMLLSSMDLGSEEFIDQLASLEDTKHTAKLVDVTERIREQEAKKQQRRLELRLEDDVEKPPTVIVIPRSLVYAAGIAVAALIAVLVYPHLAGDNGAGPVVAGEDPGEGLVAEPSPPPIVATLTQSYQPEWSDDSLAIEIGDRMAAGVYQLERGAVTLSFDRGATALIQAPARFELIGDNHGRIELGRITATVPPQAVGFTIDTPTSRVVDFGTEFGVSVGDEGETLAAVFKGLVELSEKPTAENTRPAKVSLQAGYQAEVDTDAKLASEVRPIDPTHVFSRDMADVRFRPRLEGATDYLRDTPESLAPGRLTNLDQMWIFRERAGVRLTRSINGALVEPGSYTAQVLRNKAGRVRAGEHVDAYLVHYDSGMINNPPGDATTPPIVTASFEFSRDVIAVIADGKLLYETDVIFAQPLIEMPARSDFGVVKKNGVVGNGRGVEYKNSVDTIEISEDRRRVTLTISATLIDQVRILTEPAD